MKPHAVVLLALPLALAACAVVVPVDPGTGDACGASRYQYLVGMPGVMLDGMRFRQDVRVIQYGTMVTMDFKAERLNFWLDRRDVIERVICG